MKLWSGKGLDWTKPTVEAGLERANELGIEYVVVASNTGRAARHLDGCGKKVVVVTHHAGFKGAGVQEMTAEEKKSLQAKGWEVLTTTHLFANIERSITNKQGGWYPGGIVSNTLRMFGQGTKVCFEIATMALDAGMIPAGKEILVLGGSGGGCDTAMIMVPAHSNVFFDGKAIEIICKPRIG
jgi:uncharacterized protein